ncbi:hypothetical protein PI124_g16904 [Phytophthora idaei]|nr:hypothetical protein PI124_g16904 [Phytophthora idaei]
MDDSLFWFGGLSDKASPEADNYSGALAEDLELLAVHVTRFKIMLAHALNLDFIDDNGYSSMSVLL